MQSDLACPIDPPIFVSDELGKDKDAVARGAGGGVRLRRKQSQAHRRPAKSGESLEDQKEPLSRPAPSKASSIRSNCF
jgi:hypothetical protein